MERAHEGGEEGKDAKRNELHDWSVREESRLEERVVRRERGGRRYLYETGVKFFLITHGMTFLIHRWKNLTWKRGFVPTSTSLSGSPTQAPSPLNRWSLVMAVQIPPYHEGNLH